MVWDEWCEVRCGMASALHTNGPPQNLRNQKPIDKRKKRLGYRQRESSEVFAVVLLQGTTGADPPAGGHGPVPQSRRNGHLYSKNANETPEAIMRCVRGDVCEKSCA